MNGQSLELRFKLGPIPVVVEPSFWLAGLMMGANLSGARLPLWLGILFVSILIHELGHALTARLFGARAWVQLYSFGGLAHPDRPLPKWRAIAMTLAGPFAGFAFGALVFALSSQVMMTSATAYWAVQQLLWINVIWGAVNLLPIYPLDGGHVLSSLLGPRHARTTRIVGVALGVAMVLFALATRQLPTALLFGYLTWQNVNALRRL
ncbi:MAG: site-2 protease family protein [Myxococcales bacterium]|nr:site-2 protease family protein [Myxococcales bacterium]